MVDVLHRAGMVASLVAVVLALWASALADFADMSPDTCLTLDPFDSALPQTGPCPFVLKISKSDVIHNQDSVIVTIKSEDPRIQFEKFIVHARDNETGVAVGKFVDLGNADINIMNCFYRPENTALEFDSEPKDEAQMRWMPDFDYEGSITFLATVVQTKEIFWLRMRGARLKIYNPW